jgi:hypothetical protein
MHASSLGGRKWQRALAGSILTGLTCGLAGCSVTHLADAPVEEREWTSAAGVKGEELLTPHFDLRVTATDKVLRAYLPDFMEAAFQGYSEMMPPTLTPTERLVVYVFGTRDQWAGFTTATYPEQAWTYLHIHSGGYTDVASATAVGYDLRRDHTLSLLGHEGFHQYLARYFPQPVTPWLNEGLACQWEAFDLVGRHPIFTPRRNFLRKSDLRETLTVKPGMIPLPALLSMDAGAAIRQTGHPVRAYYAQVWSLVLFLRDHPKYGEGFRALLADAGTSRVAVGVSAYRAATPGAEKMSDGEVIFRQYITDDLDACFAEYRAFCTTLADLREVTSRPSRP